MSNWRRFSCDFCKINCSVDEDEAPWHYAQFNVCSRECYMALRTEQAMLRLAHALETPERLSLLKYDLGLI